jgi:colanic acid/amylovoran biosynthesis protein
LQARIRDVLGGAHLIALREGRVGRALLESLGVAGDKIVVSGDDAIEPAYEGRPGTVGNDIGVGIRFAWYSSLGPENVRFLSSAVADTARRHGAVLRPIPIDWRDARDLSALRSVLEGYSGQVIWPADDSPEAVIGQTGRCRVVVTGSYHAGVFALAQGIPVVALAKSQYYVDKFSGLAELFRGGCAVLTFDSPDFGAALVAAIDRAWQSAAAARPLLIEAAIRQIEASRSVYGRIAALVHH